ncbi:MAG: hypothetical protein JEZ03_08195 [Bacteroidales bacterium]|nr:hypothetical protein [Bacteroidales bacterium]
MEKNKKQIIKDWVRLAVITAVTIFAFNYIIEHLLGVFKEKAEIMQSDTIPAIEDSTLIQSIDSSTIVIINEP